MAIAGARDPFMQLLPLPAATAPRLIELLWIGPAKAEGVVGGMGGVGQG
jgi:hypothetical protein